MAAPLSSATLVNAIIFASYGSFTRMWEDAFEGGRHDGDGAFHGTMTSEGAVFIERGEVGLHELIRHHHDDDVDDDDRDVRGNISVDDPSSSSRHRMRSEEEEERKSAPEGSSDPPPPRGPIDRERRGRRRRRQGRPAAPEHPKDVRLRGRGGDGHGIRHVSDGAHQVPAAGPRRDARDEARRSRRAVRLDTEGARPVPRPVPRHGRDAVAGDARVRDVLRDLRHDKGTGGGIPRGEGRRASHTEPRPRLGGVGPRGGHQRRVDVGDHIPLRRHQDEDTDESARSCASGGDVERRSGDGAGARVEAHVPGARGHAGEGVPGQCDHLPDVRVRVAAIGRRGLRRGLFASINPPEREILSLFPENEGGKTRLVENLNTVLILLGYA